MIAVMVLLVLQCTASMPAVQASSPPPPPPPPPPLPSDYTPPPMKEEWQLEMSWEEWYWANMAQDYMNHKLTPEQEQILLNEVHQGIANSPPCFKNGEYAIIYAMAANLDPQHYFSNQYTLGVVMR